MEINKMKRQFDQTKIVIGVIVLLALLRVLFPLIDSPDWFTGDLGLFADEGYKTLHAKNKAVFDEVRIDERDSYGGWSRLSPISHNLFLLSFTLFGTGYLQARIVNWICAAISLVLFYFILRRAKPKYALLGVVLLGINFSYLVYNKIALLETMLTMFLLASALCFQQKNKWFVLLSTVFFMCAYLVKPLAIFFLPVLAFMFWDKLHFLKKKVMFKAGLGFLGVFILAIILFPQIIRYFIIFIGERHPESLSVFLVLLRQFWYRSYFMMNAPLVLALMVGFPLLVQKVKKFTRLDFMFVIWTASFGLMMMLQTYRPPRYFVVITPALIYIFTLLFDNYSAKIENKFIFASSVGAAVLVFMLFYFKAFELYFAVNNMLYLVITLVLVGLSFVFALKFKHFKWSLGKVLIIVYVVSNLFLIGLWFGTAEHKLVDHNHDLKEVIGDANIMGINWVPAFCMELDNKCFHTAGVFNEKDEVFDAYEIEYFLTDDYTNPEYGHVVYLQNPNFEKSLTYIKTYSISKFRVDLYKFDRDVFYGREE